jgi:hypothetical protein
MYENNACEKTTASSFSPVPANYRMQPVIDDPTRCGAP